MPWAIEAESDDATRGLMAVAITLTLTDAQLTELARMVAPLVDAALRQDPAPAPKPLEQFVSVREAAQAAKVTPSTVYRWCADGRLTRHGTAGRALVERGELIALLTARGHPPGPVMRRPVRPKRRTTFSAKVPAN